MQLSSSQELCRRTAPRSLNSKHRLTRFGDAVTPRMHRRAAINLLGAFSGRGCAAEAQAAAGWAGACCTARSAAPGKPYYLGPATACGAASPGLTVRSLSSAAGASAKSTTNVPLGHHDSDLSAVACHIGLGRRGIGGWGGMGGGLGGAAAAALGVFAPGRSMQWRALAAQCLPAVPAQAEAAAAAWVDPCCLPLVSLAAHCPCTLATAGC